MKKGSWSVLGVGPIYFISIISMRIMAIILDRNGVFTQRKWYLKEFWVMTGILLIISGIFLWMKAVIFQRIDQKIKKIN